jgi:signal transduction histidine kinase
LSLRARIILLFLGFSVLPVVFLGVGDYYQSLEALRVVLAARSEALAEQTAREVEDAHLRARAALVAASRLPDFGGHIGPFTRVLVVDPAAEAVPTTSCSADGTIPVRAGPSQDGIVVQGDLPAATLLAWAPTLRAQMGKTGYSQVLHRKSGRVVFDARCLAESRSADPAYLEPAIGRAVALLTSRHGLHASLRYENGGGEAMASLSTAGADWVVVVHTSATEFIAPFRQARALYLGLVLLVMTFAAGAFLYLAQGAFRSLRLVTSAADQIEVGNLRPWLPPPGNDEVGRLSLAFRRMTERLEASVRRAELSQKLAAVGELATYLSHEIRNPLSSIRLSLQSLHRDLSTGFIPPDAPRVIELALTEVQRLDGVVRAVLEMGRPVSASEGRTCAVHAALEETLEVLRPKLRSRGVDLAYSPRADRDVVEGDAEGLRGVVINLVLNALDALEGRADGRIRISTWVQDERDLHIRVADNGPGVSPDVAESIFEPFFTTRTAGNGIGLPMALRTVQAWGGTIVHEPVAAGSGAVFVVKLKLAASPAATPAREPTLMTVRS